MISRLIKLFLQNPNRTESILKDEENLINIFDKLAGKVIPSSALSDEMIVKMLSLLFETERAPALFLFGEGYMYPKFPLHTDPEYIPVLSLF